MAKQPSHVDDALRYALQRGVREMGRDYYGGNERQIRAAVMIDGALFMVAVREVTLGMHHFGSSTIQLEGYLTPAPADLVPPKEIEVVESTEELDFPPFPEPEWPEERVKPLRAGYSVEDAEFLEEMRKR